MSITISILIQLKFNRPETLTIDVSLSAPCIIVRSSNGKLVQIFASFRDAYEFVKIGN